MLLRLKALQIKNKIFMKYVKIVEIFVFKAMLIWYKKDEIHNYLYITLYILYLLVRVYPELFQRLEIEYDGMLSEATSLKTCISKSLLYVKKLAFFLRLRKTGRLVFSKCLSCT